MNTPPVSRQLIDVWAHVHCIYMQHTIVLLNRDFICKAIESIEIILITCAFKLLIDHEYLANTINLIIVNVLC